MTKRLLKWIVAGALLSMPAAAQIPVQWGNLSFGGNFQGLQPGGVLVGTPSGNVLLPMNVATFQMGGVQVSLQQLQGVPVGTPMTVMLPNQGGQIVGFQNDLAQIAYPGGQYAVPINAFPVNVRERIPVFVQLPDGQVVQAPMNAALNLRRSRRGQLMTHCPPGAQYIPVNQYQQWYSSGGHWQGGHGGGGGHWNGGHGH